MLEMDGKGRETENRTRQMHFTSLKKVQVLIVFRGIPNSFWLSLHCRAIGYSPACTTLKIDAITY
jgi:hypothetical protein